MTYRPGAYRLFTIYERKPRLIAAAPFPDRVVHHAVMNVIEPPLDRRFIIDSYACRKGKGVHLAVDRYQGWAQRYRYALKLDVRRYFPSIDQAILKEVLRHHLRDERVLALLDLIIDTGPESAPAPPVYFPGNGLLTPLERRCGIPIGNLTSQFFANLYLNDLDHGVKEVLRAPAYLRYVDDMVLLDDDKGRLLAGRDWIEDQLATLRLQLHLDLGKVSQVGEGIDLLGYHVFPHHRRLRNENGLRFRRPLARVCARLRRGPAGLGRLRSERASLDWPRLPCRHVGIARKYLRSDILSAGTGRRAARVCCGAARGTTNRRGCAGLRATGTTRTTGTRTGVFAWPVRPPSPRAAMSTDIAGVACGCP